MRVTTAFTLLFTLTAQTVLSQPTSPPPHLDPVNRTLWSDARLGIRFTYPSVWQLVTATQPSTRVVINWHLNKSKALLASCYIETYGSEISPLARSEPSMIHKNVDSIAQSALRNLRARAPNARLLEARAAIQDGHSVIFLVRDGTIESFDRNNHLKVYSIITTWRGTEITFECGTSIFGPKFTSVNDGERTVVQVEEGILNVLRTLQFDRVQY